MSDSLDTLADEVFGEATAPAELAAPPAEAPQEATPQPEAPVETPPEAPAQPEAPKEEHTVPLAKYLDTRDELKELRRFKAEQEAKAQAQPPVQAPDPYDDPEGYRAFHQAEVQRAVTAQKFEMSDVMARQSHGAETVEAAAEWALGKAQADPVFAAQYMRESHPIDWIVRQHKRDGLLQQVGEDPDEFVRRRAAELGLIAQPAAGAQVPAVSAQQVPKPAAPPKSLVGAPSAGGVQSLPVGPLAGVEAVFPR
jgi:hypothetical protein